MEKQLVKTLVVTFLFVMGYMFIMSKYFPKQTPPPVVSSGTQASGSPNAENEKPSNIQIHKETEKLPETTIDNFSVTYSPKGGYIKNIFLKNYQTELLLDNIGFVQKEQDVYFQPKIQDNKIIFTSPSGYKKEFIFDNDSLGIKFSSPLNSPIILFSKPLNSKKIEHRNQELFYYDNQKLQRVNTKKIDSALLNNVKFAGTSDYHFCISLVSASYNIQWLKDSDNIYLAVVPPVSELQLYIGPKIENKLKPFGLEAVVNYGFFHGIGIGLSKLLYFFHSFTNNWGISIILLAILTYIVLLPFTMKSTKAMKRMQEVQPEIDELRKKYKDNPQKLNKEMLELYKKYKVNPMGGCFPLLFQFPVFIALYQVLLKFVELKNANFLWIQDLSLPDHAIKLPFPPPIDYINILPLLIVIVGLIQQKVASPMSGASEQKSMGLIMVVMMGVIFYNFPAGLTLYWLTQNILTLAYQARIAKVRFHVKTT